MGRNWVGVAVPFLSGVRWVPIEQEVAWAEAYHHTKWRLVHLAVWPQTDIGRKLGAVPL